MNKTRKSLIVLGGIVVVATAWSLWFDLGPIETLQSLLEAIGDAGSVE